MIKQLLPLLAVLPGLLHAQVIPFTLDGALDSVTADTDEYNTGGKISVNGVNIVVPKNLQFQFPAAWVGVKEMAEGKFLGNEVTVYGNYVNGEARAAIVQIAQFALEANSGKIKELSPDGKITLEGGQVVRINDPNAVFSAGYKLHPAFTADDVNPSITAFSGFPMCVPRSDNDPKCPSSNRPAGQTSFNAPDPLTMAPFKVGDYLEIEGHKVGDEIIAYGITCPSVQILTPNGPTYIRVEEALIGVIDRQSTNVVEFADSRMIGYTSTPGGSVHLTRSEIDPCTGKVVDQDIGSATPQGARLKWEWRSESTALVKYAREYKATSSNGVKETNGGQILAGQYIAPVAEWIFPEITAPGTQPAKLDFTQMTWLTNGLGPDSNGKVWGPIVPWPDTSSPAAPKACEATTPTTSSTPVSSDTTTPTSAAPSSSGTPDPTVPTPLANAGPDLKIKPSATASLVGTINNTASFSTDDLTYSWTQIAGPAVTFTAGTATAATAKFVVPSASSSVSYSFELTVSSKSKGTQSKDTVVVGNNVDTVTITAYTWTNTQGGTISVTAQTTNTTAKLSLQLMNPNAGTALVMVPLSGSPGKWTYNARSTKQPSQGIKVSSNGDGSATRTTVSQKLKRWHARFFGTA